MSKIQNIVKVVSNKKLSPKFNHLILEGKGIASQVKPGQFIHIRTSKGFEPFFRRPFSVFRAKKNIEILFEVVGKGTHLLSQKKPGDELDILGPLGNSFQLPPKQVKTVIMIAGGVGVAPFLALSDELKNKYELILLYGGRTKDYIFNMKQFKDNGCKVYLSTDNGSVGAKGRVSVLFPKIKINPKETFIYTCGPKPMMKAVQEFAKAKGFKGQLSAEEVMACGMGACLGCAIKTKHGFKTVCHDGPVFDLEDINFEK